MGVFRTGDFSERYAEDFHHPSDCCFLCCEPLGGDVWIFWNGYSGQVWFHPGCAKIFSDKLAVDWEKFRREHPEKV